jgi:flagellar assembly factor FliW
MSEPMHSDVSQKEGATLSFNTRFGQVELREDRLLEFPQGLFGFRECTQFGLAKLPAVDNSPLMLLQCVNQPSIAFLVADPSHLGVELGSSDVSEALTETSMPASDTQFLTILTLYDQGESYYLTANLKAPVLINSSSRTGLQFIFSNKSYSTQHKL